MRGCHLRTRTYKPRASSLVRSQSHVLSGSSPWKRLSRVGRLCTVDQPASEVEGRYPRRGNVRMYGPCARKITAIEDEGMMARQCLGGVNCFGTGLRVCCLSAAAYYSGSVLSLSFTHSRGHSLTHSLSNLGTPRGHTGRHFICFSSASSAKQAQPHRGTLRPRSVVSTTSVWSLHRCHTRLDPIQSGRD